MAAQFSPRMGSCRAHGTLKVAHSWSEELNRLPGGLEAADVRMVVAEQPDLIAWPEGTRYVDADLPAGYPG